MLERAEAENRLFILPVPIGGTLYRIVLKECASAENDSSIILEQPGTAYVRSFQLGEYNLLHVMTQEKLGETIFLTREEATKKMKALYSKR